MHMYGIQAHWKSRWDNLVFVLEGFFGRYPR
jgi:hypothetical protein